MRRPLLAVVGMFKDEAANIRALLESVKHVADRWTIFDTGSTDGTQDIIREVMKDVPGELYEEPFVDFGTTRNRVLEMAERGGMHTYTAPPVWSSPVTGEGLWSPVFTLMMSGDEVLVDGEKLRQFLEAHRDAPEGAYNMELRADTTRWEYPRILRTGAGWKYYRKIHEVPAGPKGESKVSLVPGAHIVHTIVDVARRARRIKEFDIPTLRQEVEDESQSLEKRAAAMYFLAESYTSLAAELAKAAGDEDKLPPGSEWLSYQMQAMGLYWRCGQLFERQESPIFDVDKARLAQFFYFHIAVKAGLYLPAEIVPRLKLLAKGAPRQPEVHYAIAQQAMMVDVQMSLFFATRAAKLSAAMKTNPTSHLPTDSRIEWLAYGVACMCSMHLKNAGQAKAYMERAIAAGAPPEMVAKLRAQVEAQ